jgi:CheY-like chemotaxis protein
MPTRRWSADAGFGTRCPEIERGGAAPIVTFATAISGQHIRGGPMQRESERSGRPITILMADDDADDRFMTRDAFRESRLANELRFVEDGEELMDYLHRRNQYSDLARSPRPGLILLDLNMPRKDGREALQELKQDPRFRPIRVIVLTTSKAEEDILRTYNLSAASYITKPVTFESLVDVVKTLGKYWLEIVELPENGDSAG